MKPNRSNKFTKGLVCTYANSPLRSFFFELDSEHKELYQDICDFYNLEELDFIVHRTGGGGYHFISPTNNVMWLGYRLTLQSLFRKCY